MSDVNTSMGFAHFIAQSDVVGKARRKLRVGLDAIECAV